MSAGYSKTPLAKKLGYKAGFTVRLLQAPLHYREISAPWPEDCRESDDPSEKVDLIHVFEENDSGLPDLLAGLMLQIKPDGMIWVSWPKGRSKVPGALTEDKVRDAALPLGLVDVKVCAVDEKWSGLKLVIRKELRG